MLTGCCVGEEDLAFDGGEHGVMVALVSWIVKGQPEVTVNQCAITIDKLPKGWQHRFMLINFIHNMRIFPVGCLLLLCASTSAIAADKHLFEAKAAKLVGGASKVADSAASGGSLAGLSKPGQGVKFARLPAASKLAIRYASVQVGTISVAVNDQPARKVNVHSSGALTNSFLHCHH